MDNEAVEMSYEADVLDRVMDEHDIPRKRLAAKMSIHKATISKWLSSTTTIPVTAFRNLFDLTHDPRLIRLITGETPGFFQITLDTSDGSENRMQIPPLDQLVPQACEATEQTAAALKYIARIAQDGKVDDADRQAIEQFRKHAAHAQRLLCLTTAALTVYEKRGATR